MIYLLIRQTGRLGKLPLRNQDSIPAGRTSYSRRRGKMPRRQGVVPWAGKDAPSTNGPLIPFLLDN